MFSKNTTYLLVALVTQVILGASCKKFTDVGNPEAQLDRNSVFSSNATAVGAQLSIYAQMENNGMAYNMIITPGVTADEFTSLGTTSAAIDLATNNLTADNITTYSFWTNFYKYIYQANAVIEGMEKSTAVSGEVKKQLIGEAKFTRAFCYFYLVNLFGDVPITKSTDYKINESITRSPVIEVYDFIVADLVDALSLLSNDYLSPSNVAITERVRPNKAAASALLARVYLYTGKWAEADAESSKVIAASATYYLNSNLNNSFLKNNSEAIWQLMPVTPGYNSYPGSQFVTKSTPTVVSVDTNLVKSFRASDNRKVAWILPLTVSGKTYFLPNKYKVGQNVTPITEYTVILRLSEQYLIRAEARAKLNNISGGTSDLNAVRVRAGLPALTGLTQASLTDSIQVERKFELFAEFADRWLNLKRTGTVNQVMTPLRGSSWSSSDQLYPIPLVEINRNSKLTQNPGY